MGISYSVLFKKSSYNDVLDLYKAMEDICKINRFYCKLHYKEEDENGEIKKIDFNVSDKKFEDSVSRQLCISLFDEPYRYKEISFEWYKEEVFFEAVVIDFVEGNEDLLLKILYGFMKKYKEAVLWGEEDWFYFYDDIIRMKREEFDAAWCYKNPH